MWCFLFPCAYVHKWNLPNIFCAAFLNCFHDKCLCNAIFLVIFLLLLFHSFLHFRIFVCLCHKQFFKKKKSSLFWIFSDIMLVLLGKHVLQISSLPKTAISSVYYIFSIWVYVFKVLWFVLVWCFLENGRVLHIWKMYLVLFVKLSSFLFQIWICLSQFLLDLFLLSYVCQYPNVFVKWVMFSRFCIYCIKFCVCWAELNLIRLPATWRRCNNVHTFHVIDHAM